MEVFGRIDNGIFYQSPTFAGVTVLLAGSFQTSGQEKEEWTDNTRFWGGSVDWKYGNFGLFLGAEQTVLGPDSKGKEQNGGKNPTTLYLGTSYDFGFMKLMAGYQHGWDLDRFGCFDKVKWGTKTSQIEAFDANSYILGATIPAWGGTVRLSGLYSEGTNSKPLYTKSLNNSVAVGPDAGYWAVDVGYSYPFSKRTNIYGVISHLEGLDGLDTDDTKNKMQAVNDDGSMSRTQIAVGLVHKF